MEAKNSIVCSDCHGTSQRVVMRTVRQYAKIETPPPCDRCNGTGRVPRPRPVSILSSRITQVRRTRAGLEGGMWPVLSPGTAAGHNSAGSDSL
jgi:hypothetical protein